MPRKKQDYHQGQRERGEINGEKREIEKRGRERKKRREINGEKRELEIERKVLKTRIGNKVSKEKESNDEIMFQYYEIHFLY